MMSLWLGYLGLMEWMSSSSIARRLEGRCEK
jgi:hypothetical protein